MALTVTLDALLTLAEVAPLVGMTRKSAQHKVKRGHFPIRHVPGLLPYRFTTRDTQALTERGEVTNPSLIGRAPRHHFGRATRAKALRAVAS